MNTKKESKKTLVIGLILIIISTLIVNTACVSIINNKNIVRGESKVSFNDKHYNKKTYNTEYVYKNSGILDCYRKGLNGKGVNVAVIDFGLKTKDVNPKFTYNIPQNKKNVSFDPLHGTAIAGIIKATPNNKIGTVGISHKCNYYHFNISTGNGTSTSGYMAEALNYIYDNLKQIDIINISLSYPNESITVKKIINKLVKERGVIVVAPVGDDHGNRVVYPAGYKNVIGVSSIDTYNKNKHIKGSSINKSVDIVAPGMDMRALAPNNKIRIIYGTSLSSAYVTGMLALAKQRDPSLTYSKVIKLFKKTSFDKGTKTRNNTYGYGVINVNKLVGKINSDKKVKLYTNGGSFKTSSKTLYINKKDKKYNIPTPVKKGYKFKGWYTKKKGGKKIKNIKQLKTNKNHKLYARYIKKA